MGESGSCPIAETRGVRIACDRAHQPLVGERQQVLDRATAARDDDDVDRGVALEGLDRRDHLAGGVHALHRGVLHGEVHARPAAAAVVEHVALGGRVLGGDQPDVARQERQRTLELLGEQTLRRQQLAAPLEPGQQLALTDQPDLADGERERAAVGVERRLGVADDLRALDQRRGQRVDDAAVAGDLDRDVGELVAQGEEHRVHAAPTADLGDLALDPDGARAGRSTEPIAWVIWRTGAGCSGEVSNGHAATLRPATYDWRA